MKKSVLLLFVLLLTSGLSAQDAVQKDALWTITRGEHQYRIGAYAGINTKYSTYDSDPAGYLDLRAAVTLNGKYALGFSASGLYFDKKLRRVVNDGTYHIYAGYAGLFFARMFRVNEDMKLALSIFTGQGEAYYQYDKDYRENRPWYQEVIDRETFHVIEPGIEIEHRLKGNFWIGLTGSYRFTSPVELISTKDDLFQTFSYGISFKYGIY